MIPVTRIRTYYYKGVTGDTILATTRGFIPISELEGQTPTVFSLSEDERFTVKQTAGPVIKTPGLAQPITIRCSNNVNITCSQTQWFKTDGKYCWKRAKDIKINDILIVLANGRSGAWTGQRYKVLGIELTPNRDYLYTMEVPETNNFIANNFVLYHNEEVY